MPKKAKKGGKKKKNKLANMTEEEKLIYLEQKALAAQDLQKQKEELFSGFLKDRLEKEEGMSKLNVNKINEQWRQILRELKSKDLKQDIDILSQTFERVLDLKDSCIKSLAQDIEEADEQYNMALRSHLQNVDDLMDHHHRRLDDLRNEYNCDLQNLKREFEEERSLVEQCLKQEMQDLQSIMFAMEQHHEEREQLANHDYQNWRDEIKNKNLEEKHSLRIQLENMIESLWKQFQANLRHYNETTEERRLAFEFLKAKDERSAWEIELQMKKILRLAEMIAQLKAKMQQNAREWEERNQRLRRERERLHMYFQQRKAQMHRARELQRFNLTTLTLQSNGAIKKLEKVKNKGEHILKFGEMCRQRETEEEKVLPFYKTTLSPDDVDDADTAALQSPDEPLADLMHDYRSMENFWKRYNKVLLDKYALDKEKTILSQENKQLRHILKQYLDGISVNDEILRNDNPLFVVNQKTNVKIQVPLMDPRVKRPMPTIVDATQVVKNATSAFGKVL